LLSKPFIVDIYRLLKTTVITIAIIFKNQLILNNIVLKNNGIDIAIVNTMTIPKLLLLTFNTTITTFSLSFTVLTGHTILVRERDPYMSFVFAVKLDRDTKGGDHYSS